MSRSARSLIGIALPILTIFIFAVLLAFSLLRLSSIESDMRIEATQNMLWVVSRTHVASLRLSEAAAKRALDEADQFELNLRHDVFLSRLALLEDGPQRRQMQALGYEDAHGGFKTSLAELSTLIAHLEPGDLAKVQAINDILEPYNAMLGQAANKAMVTEWDNLGNKLDTSRNQIWQIIVSLIGISLAGAALSVHFLMAIRDARRRTRLLDKEKAFSELLIGSSGEAIVAVDLERHCTVWNEAAERLFGLAASRTIGWNLGEVSGFFQIDRIEQALGDALEGHATALLDQPFFPSGRHEPFYVDLRCFSLRDGACIIGSILLISDVTERRAAQREIAEHRDHLEHLVQARTHELDAALERERATADLYRNFGTMISHQFRTPLAIVDSALQRLMRRSDILTPDEVLERGDKARGAIARLIKLVESTLDAARLDTGQIEIRARPCDLGQLTAEICSRQSEMAHGGKIRIEVDGQTPAIAHCDPVHAEQILVNLLSNAVKYSPAEASIDVAVYSDGDLIVCSVTNPGGIACPAERGNLFERYFRGRNAEGRPGIGIGLYMARTLARMQGGDLTLDDSDLETTTFRLTLPRQDVSASAVHARLQHKELA